MNGIMGEILFLAFRVHFFFFFFFIGTCVIRDKIVANFIKVRALFENMYIYLVIIIVINHNIMVAVVKCRSYLVLFLLICISQSQYRNCFFARVTNFDTYSCDIVE